MVSALSGALPLLGISVKEKTKNVDMKSKWYPVAYVFFHSALILYMPKTPQSVKSCYGKLKQQFQSDVFQMLMALL